MTRAERAAEQVKKMQEKKQALERAMKAKLAEQQLETRRAEAALREVVRKEDNKRRYHVGALAHEAGLFAWSNADLKAVFAVLATLGDLRNPAAVLLRAVEEAGVSGFLDDLERDHPIAPCFSPPNLARFNGETSEIPA